MRLLPVMAQDEEYYDDETPAKRKKEKKGKKNQKETTENLFSAVNTLYIQYIPLSAYMW